MVVQLALAVVAGLLSEGVPPAPVRPLPVQEVAPGVPVDGPAPELAEEMRGLHQEIQRRRGFGS